MKNGHVIDGNLSSICNNIKELLQRLSPTCMSMSFTGPDISRVLGIRH